MGTPRKKTAQLSAQKLAIFNPAPLAAKALQKMLLQTVN
jgi:hypothetical protein